MHAILLLSRAPEAADAIPAAEREEAAVYEYPCGEASGEGMDVPGSDGAAAYQVEACGASCRPAYDSARRDGDVLFVSCDPGETTVRAVLLR